MNFLPSWASLWLLVLATALAGLALLRLRRRVQIECRRRAEIEGALTLSGHLEALASALSKAQTPAEMTPAALSELLYALGASSGLIALVNDEGDHLDFASFMGYGDAAVPADRSIPLTSSTLLCAAVRERRSIALASQADRAERLGGLTLDPVLADAEATLIVPLNVAGRPLGAVALNFDSARSATDREQAFLASAAQRIAVALDRGHRYERTQRERADAEALRLRADRELRERRKAEEALRESEAKNRALAARTNRLYALSAGLSEAITVDAVAQVIVRHGKNVVGSSAASVALLTDNQQLETLSAEEYPLQTAETWERVPVEPGYCSTAAIQNGEPVFVSSFAEWQREYPRSASMAADGGYASAATLPLLVDAAPVGVLSFHFTAPVNFDSEYRALLTSVAHHAAQAIDRARLYETAQRARAEAEEANRSKDDFLSMVSHELRTPLSALLGWASMLRAQTLQGPRAARAIEAIHSNATRQAHLIDELLDVSRMVAGRLALELQEIDLAEVVRAAIEMILPLVEEKGLNIHLDPFPKDVRVVADPRRLEQVFVNLLGNAVKFTPANGLITVALTASPQSADVRVADTGRGIDPDFAPHVFERFRQAGSGFGRRVSGLGLGLFIAQRLVVAHGGQIRAESEGEGRGAAFTVSLPRAAATAQKPPDGAEAHPQNSEAAASC